MSSPSRRRPRSPVGAQSELSKVIIRWASPDPVIERPSVVHDPYASLYCTSCPAEGWCPECGSYDPPPVSLETLELIAAASRPRNIAVGVLSSRKHLES